MARCRQASVPAQNCRSLAPLGMTESMMIVLLQLMRHFPRRRQNLWNDRIDIRILRQMIHDACPQTEHPFQRGIRQIDPPAPHDSFHQ